MQQELGNLYEFLYQVTPVVIIIIIIIINLFKVDDIAKILHAQKIYIKLSNTRI